jgi:type III secretion system YscQ/HrcQ family protein
VIALRRVRAHLGETGGAALRRWARAHLGEAGSVELRAQTSTRSVGDLRELIAEGALVVTLQGPDGQRATLVLDRGVTALLVGMLLRMDPRPLVRAPTTAEQGLALYAVAGVLLELGAGCPWTATIERAPEVSDDVAVIEAELCLDSRAGIGWLLLDAELAQRLSDRDGGGGRHQRLEGVFLTLAVELGRVPLPDGELETLGPGDVILSPRCPRGRGPYAALLRVGSAGYHVTVEGEAVRVESWTHGGLTMSTTEEQESARVARQLPVELVIELGRVQLTAAQVMVIETGDVLTLARAVGTTVDLRVGERLLGRGELVDVEGEAGVRVVEVFD